MSTINPVSTASYVPPVSTASTKASSTTSDSNPIQDAVELSLAGRIALGVSAGRLTSAQGQQLDSQLKTINEAIQSGGTNVNQSLSQLSETIYGDAHNGASIPAGLTVTHAEARDFEQAGRIVVQEGAGNLTSSQASQFFSQMKQIYQQSQGGATASATNQAQNQLSLEIFDAAHNINNNSTPTS